MRILAHTSTTSSIKVMNVRSRVERTNHSVLPPMMEAATHDIVHYVIFGRHAGEHLVHPCLLFTPWNLFKPCGSGAHNYRGQQ
jgi:hypothetical protein